MSNDPIDEELLRQQEEEQKQKQEYTVGGDGNNNGNKRNGDKGSEDNGNGNGKPPSKDDKLAELASESISLLFRDQYDIAHAVVEIKDHYEIVKVESSKFKRYLSRLYYESEHQVIKAESITNVVQVIQAKAEFEGQTIPLALRVTWDNNNDICYDLTNDEWQYIKISKDGYWQLINNNTPKPIFVRHKQTAQVLPARDYEPDVFDRFLRLTNLKDEKDRILLKVYVVSLFIPDIPHVILIAHGKQGSAKSTLENMIKLLVDPAKPKLLTVYSDVKEFIQQLAHNYVAYYDNLKKAPGWLSDESCKAVTGVGSTKRKLYSDDDDIVYEYKRCLGFSGINASLTEPDALDRSIMIELERIKPEDRKDEKIIITEFLELRAKLLGYIFDILAKALQTKDSIKLKDLPRMADFALWGEAIARAMGYNDLDFIKAYYENIGKQNIEAIENHPLGQIIIRYIGENQICEGSPSEVLDKLETCAIQNNVKIDTKSKYWPKAGNSFTRRLNQISSNLLEGPGIDVQISRILDRSNGNGKVNTTVVKIGKVGKIPPIPPIPPTSQNHEGDEPKSVGDISSVGDTIPPAAKIPPTQNTENRAQNGAAGDVGDVGGIFSTKGGDLSFLYSCYHCDDFHTNNQDYYENHMARKHFKLPAYPSIADLQRHGLKAQGKEWER